MRAPRLVIVIAALGVAVGVAAHAQQSGAATATIRGVVVGDSDSRPLRQAHVVLIGTATGTIRVTSTDGDGRFAFTGLPADRYTIGASKPPFLGAVAGARRPARPGSPVAVSDGETIADVTIRLPRAAAIAGVVTDERGSPAAMTVVTAYQLRTDNGDRVLAEAAAARADDRGRYRIHGLVPGEYVVAVTRMALVAPRAQKAADIDEVLKTGRPSAPETTTERYAPVFYPGTVRLADAQPLLLGVGDERSGVDLPLMLIATARLEGTVSGPDGQPATATVTLSSYAPDRQPLNTFGFFGSAAAGGRFVLSGIAPGTYTIRATSRDGYLASETIEVTGADRSGIQLTLRPPLTLTGRIAFEGAAVPPALDGHRVPIRALGAGSSGSTPSMSVTDTSGAFRIARLMPGRYLIGGPVFFGASDASVTWALTSVTVDGGDVTDLPFEITADAPPGEIVVTYGDRWQEIRGHLLQASGAPAAGYVVVAFPDERAYWIDGSRRIVIATSGAGGEFTLGGPGPLTLPPGAYLLAVVPDLERGEQFDRAFLSALVPAAVRVTLQPGERKAQDLRIK
jgi:hypothetical protein